MKLILTNFKCYSNRIFEFEDDTITLIRGPSGQGKTTILLAIQFALYGLSNHKYLTSYTSNSCQVYLEYKNFKIKRTKTPNILNLTMNDKFYENKEAQIIINKYFGCIGCIQPINFLDLSHLEKMEFLEKIVNENYDVKDLKNRIKMEIFKLNKELAILDGKITTTTELLNLIQKPDKVNKPIYDDYFKPNSSLKDLFSDELNLKKNQTIKCLEVENNKNIKFNALKAEENFLNSEIQSLHVNDHKIETTILNLNSLLTSLKDKDDQYIKMKENFIINQSAIKEFRKYEHIKDEDALLLEESINLLNNEIDQNLRYDEAKNLNKLNCEYHDILNQEMNEWKNKVTNVSNKINALKLDTFEHKNLKKLEEIKFKFEEAYNFNLKYNLIEIQDQIESLKLNFYKSFNCSKCNHKFSINMDTFEMVDLDINSKDVNSKDSLALKNVKEDIKKLEMIMEKLKLNNEIINNINISQIMENIDVIKNNNKYSKELKELESFEPSITLKKLQKRILKLESEISLKLPENFEIKDLDVLKDKRRDLTIKYNKIQEKLTIKNDLKLKIKKDCFYDINEHQKILTEIEGVNKLLSEKNIELNKLKTKQRLMVKYQHVLDNINELNFNDQIIQEYENLIKEIDLGLQYHKQFEDYKNFQKQLKKYKQVKDSLKTHVDLKKNMEQNYLKTLLFKQKVIESEHESLEFMIQIINTHLSILLKDFFSESFGDPIEIFLELLSDKRPQVNIVINYKGNKVDYKSLSTGECSRIKLAFELTFKEILGEKIIMLDECTANLDQNLSINIFNKIKDTFPSKTILVVAHQCGGGTFSHVLNL